MIVVLTKNRDQIPYNGIGLDARQPVMLRNFRQRLQRESCKHMYTVLLDYVPGKDADDLLRNYTALGLKIVLYGEYIVQNGLPQEWQKSIMQWLEANGRPSERRYIQLTKEQKQALAQLNLQVSDIGNFALIKQRYKDLVRLDHPDKGGSGLHQDALRHAYSILRQP